MEMSRKEIESIIPHRDPFLLLDKVVKVDYGKRIKAIKYIKEDDPYFKGHFPGNPIMPGVLTVETIAQAGAVLMLMIPENKGKLVLFAGIDKARFKRIVKPGDELTIELELKNSRRRIGRAVGKAMVGKKSVCITEILFALA